MTRRCARCTGLAVSVAALIAMTGCSSSRPATATQSSDGSTASPTSSSSSVSSAVDLAPAEVLRRSVAAARSARTFRLRSTGKNAFDVHFGTNGAAGTVRTAGGLVRLIAVDGSVYQKAPAAFYLKESGATPGIALSTLSHSWVKSALASKTGKEYGELLDRRTLVNGLVGGFTSATESQATELGNDTVDGVVTETYSDGTGDGTLDIAATGIPYLLRATDSKDDVTLTFSDWNRPFSVSAPPSSDTISLPR